MEAFLLIAAPMEVKARTVLFLLALLLDQPLQLDVPMVECHHTAVPMEDPDQIVLFQPDPH